MHFLNFESKLVALFYILKLSCLTFEQRYTAVAFDYFWLHTYVFCIRIFFFDKEYGYIHQVSDVDAVAQVLSF